MRKRTGWHSLVRPSAPGLGTAGTGGWLRACVDEVVTLVSCVAPWNWNYGYWGNRYQFARSFAPAYSTMRTTGRVKGNGWVAAVTAQRFSSLAGRATARPTR